MMFLLYLDPGSGSIIAQIIGSILGAYLLFFNQFKIYFQKIKAKFFENKSNS